MRFKSILLLLTVIFSLPNFSMALRLKGGRGAEPVPVVDSIAVKAVGDSVYAIIANAKKMELQVLPQQADSVQLHLSRKVPSRELALVRFIATNPENFVSETVVYGVFTPQWQVNCTYKNSFLALKYDFGLRKWGIFDVAGNTIKMFDIKDDDMLRLACQKFPENTFFTDLMLSRE